MKIRGASLVGAFAVMVCAGSAQDKPAPVVPPGVASGKQTFMEHCTSCHGMDGRGNGPLSSMLKAPPPDLRTLAMRHDGKFPEEYVSRVVRFGNAITAHGTSEMPVWGPIFSMQEHGNEANVRKLIKQLCEYLASIQDKET